MILEAILKQQIGRTIIKSSAGGSVGNLWKLDLDNDNCFFFHCGWRLLKDNKIIMTSQDPIDVGGLISKTTPILENEKIVQIETINGYDISIMISNQYRIDIFCDIGPGSEEYNSLTNWDLCIPSLDNVLSISNLLTVVEEKYS